MFAVEPLQQAQHFFGRLAVEVAGGLVAYQQGGSETMARAIGDALLLPAGEFDRLVRGTVAQADQFERDSGMAAGARAADSVVSSSGSSTFCCAESIGIRL